MYIKKQTLCLFVLCHGLMSVEHAAAQTDNTSNLPVQNNVWISEGQGRANNPVISNNGLNMTIEQLMDKTIFQWESFNIGEGYSVEFLQPSSSSIALNRVIGNDVSNILGNLTANGSVYLINQNGILFGENSQVNTASLIASALDIDDNLFLNGSFIDAINQDQAAFQFNPNLSGNDEASIEIQEGAYLHTDDGGRILMFAPTIVNEGTIETPDGQTILAASKDKVYLTAVNDPNIRGGLLVEVETGGDVTNGGVNNRGERVGEIIAERGNITLLGLAVNQQGRVRATTSINQNGSIRLIARDSVDVLAVGTDLQAGNVNEDRLELIGLPTNFSEVVLAGERFVIQSGDRIAEGTNTGQVTLGENSVTEVVLDTTDESTASDLSLQPKSSIDIVGRQIDVLNQAEVTATSGDISIAAVADSNSPFRTNAEDETARVYLAEGSIIDTSGVENVVLPIERNSLTVELRDSDALRDSPVQRGGVLSGATVQVDLREGTDIANIQGALNQLQRGLNERMIDAGTVRLRSEGEVIQETGSTIDVSSGSIAFESGFIASTQLISQGEIINIGDADPLRTYDGILGTQTRVHERWGITETFNSGIIDRGEFVEGFVQGGAAGDVMIQAAAVRLDPNGIDATQILGPYQRSSNEIRRLGGRFELDIQHYTNVLQNIIFTDESQIQPLLDNESLFINADRESTRIRVPDLLLPGQLDISGALTTQVATNGNVTINEVIQGGAGDRLSITGGSIDVNDDIRLQGGRLDLVSEIPSGQIDPTSLRIASGVTIDTQGWWVNDNPLLHTELPNTSLFIDGGHVNIEGEGAVVLEAGSRVDTSGGVHLNSDGQFIAGRGGDIRIASVITADNGLDNAQLSLDAELQSFGIEEGGRLTLIADRFVISDDETLASTTEEMILRSDFFNQGGFSAYELEAQLHGIEISSGVEIMATSQNYLLRQIETGFGTVNSRSVSVNGQILNLSEQTLTFFAQSGLTSGAVQQLSEQIQLATNGRGLNADERFNAAQNVLQEQNIRITDTTFERNLLVELMNANNALELQTNQQGIDTLSRIGEVVAYERRPVDLHFTSIRNENIDADTSILMHEGSRIQLDPGAEISFTSDRSIFIDGHIDAPSGFIGLQIVKPILPANSDPGYLPDQSIWIGNNSYLSVAGTSIARPSGIELQENLRDALVFDAGQITLDALRGNVIVRPGSEINLSGTEAIVDRLVIDDNRQLAITPVSVYADAGRLNIDAQESIFLDGDILANSHATADSAILDITFGITNTRDRDGQGIVSNFLFGDRHITLENNVESDLEENLAFGDDLAESFNGQARLDIESLQGAGFGNLLLSVRDFTTAGPVRQTSEGAVIFGEDVALSNWQNIVLDTREIIIEAGTAEIQANTVTLGSSGRTLNFAREASSGEGIFNINANVIDLTGNLAIQNTQQVHLNSQGDIRLRGIVESNNVPALTGRFAVADHLELTAAQIYPTTFSDFVMNASQSIQVNAIGQATPVLSAGGRLTLDAPEIQQSGVLKAPFGEIILGGGQTDNVVLTENSITSVSGEEQSVLFGQTQLDATDWFYSIGTRLVLLGGNNNRPAPQQRVELDATSITIAENAQVDLSGGGDLLAYEFIPGPGGSTDILAAENAAGAFAIIPELSSGYAPIDPALSQGTDISMGQQIFFSESVAGLSSGTYTVLPARYALLPNAYLITPLQQEILPGETQTRIDGAAITAGQFVTANTNIQDSIWSAFAVESASVVHERAEYRISSANNFFANQAIENNLAIPLLPQDAGVLVLQANQSLVLNGDIIASTGNNGEGQAGRGAQIDIASDNLAVVQTVDNNNTSGIVELDVTQLNALNVESLLIGGSRTRTNTGTEITVASEVVSITEGAHLIAPDILLAAKDNVSLAANAHVEGSGQVTPFNETLILQGDGAFLRASANQQATLIRNNEQGNEGLLDIMQNATLSATESMILDASQDVNFAGNIVMQEGSLQLGAPVISLGDAQNVTEGVVLTEDNLSNINVDELILNSRNSINLYSDFDFSVSDLVLQTAGIFGVNSQTQTTLTATDTLRLTNVNSQLPTNLLANGQGDLVLNANQVELAQGDIEIDGYEQLHINATETVTGTGTHQLNVEGDLFINTGRIQGTSGANMGFNVAGAVQLHSNGQVVGTNAAETGTLVSETNFLGARLDIHAHSIESNAHIELPSGFVNFEVNGPEQNIVLNSGAVIDVSGRELNIIDQILGTNAGRVSLQSHTGDIQLNEGSSLLLSSTLGNAGELSIIAPQGQVAMNGSIAANTTAGENGHVLLDVDTLDDFSGLNQQLFSSGFTQSILLRQRSGDLLVAETDTVTAEHIELTLDTGSIQVDGTLNASGNDGGQIRLSARDTLTLSSTGEILAQANTTTGDGGSVFLGSLNNLSLAQSSRVNVSSGTEINYGGEVVLRAPRNAGNTDIMIDQLGIIEGAEDIQLHGFRTYERHLVPDTSDVAFSEASDFMTHVPDIDTRLGINGQESFSLLPEVHIYSNSNLILNQELDLLGLRFQNDNPGILTLSSREDLMINAPLTDAFESRETPFSQEFGSAFGLPPEFADFLTEGSSWSYQLIAGSDNTSANLFAVNQGQGNLILESDVAVRTGTGDIRIATGNDLILSNQTSVIYTAGEETGVGDLITDTGGFNQESLIMFTLFPNLPSYPINGGDIDIRVGGNIDANPSNQLFTAWLQRVGGNNNVSTNEVNTSWAVSFQDFQQGIATLGGGNINIHADGDINNLSVSLPTTGKQVLENNGVPLVLGGGDLVLSAGGNIDSARVLVDRGEAHIVSDAAITSSSNSDLGLILALSDAQVDVSARGSVQISSVANTTVVGQSATQNSDLGINVYVPSSNVASNFFTYSENTQVNFESLTQNIIFENNNTTNRSAIESEISSINFSVNTVDVNSLFIYPGSLQANAIQGNIQFNDSMTLFPSPQGGLDLLAGDNIITDRDSGSIISVAVSAVSSEALPNVLNPISKISELFSSELANNRLLERNTTTGSNRERFFSDNPIHSTDEFPSSIVAGGSIISRFPLHIQIPEETRVAAGANIENVSFVIQNNQADDISVIQAGQDILYPSQRNAAGQPEINEGRIEIFGPGRLDVIAGRHIDLGASLGILSEGNRFSRGLPDEGADITVMTGIQQQPDYAGFAQRYLVDDDRYNDTLIQFVTSESFSGDVIEFVSAETGVDYSDETSAIEALLTLDEARQAAVSLEAFQSVNNITQRALILDIYFNELQLAGVQDARQEIDDPAIDGFPRGFAAIETLFSGSTDNPQDYAGDLDLVFSAIRTSFGGDINFVAPGGVVNAGLAIVPVFSSSDKSADELGIIIGGPGDINGMAHGDISVNLSRIFTLGGGDITLWSSLGDIDAGRGAKSSLSVPPVEIEFNPFTGDVIEQLPPAVSGSGIQAASPPGSSPSSIFLFAPQGVVDAGEAGISASGDLLIAATEVLNADNIEVGGISVGVPVTTGVSADVAGASNLGSTSTDSALTSVNESFTGGGGEDESVTFLTIEVIGIGE